MHTRIRALLLAGLLLCLAIALSCGGGGSHPGTGSSWTYVALGDSLAFGIGAQQGYVPRYQSDIEADANPSVKLINLGVPGWTSGDLRNGLVNDPALRAAVMSAQVVTWDIGGNDLRAARNSFIAGTCGGPDNQDCLRSAVSSFTANWDTIVTQITTLRDPHSTILRTMDIYDPFVATDMASGNFTVLKGYIDQFNSHIASSATTNGIPYAQVNRAFNGASGTEDPVAKGYIAIDGLHPNDAGYKVIADLLRALGYAPLK